MTTRTIKKLVEQFVTTYIAEDGTEFDTIGGCLDYEAHIMAMRKKREMDEAFQALIIRSFVPDSLGLDDTRIYICTLNSEADYDILEKWCDIECIDTEYLAKPKSFPCRYIFFIDADNCVETEDEGFMDWARDLIKLLDATEN